jgi:isoleucyl-tRNA synthetase
MAKANTSLKLDKIEPRVSFPELEEKVLEFWDETHAFERSVLERPDSKPYVFYDGPPFATGTPHYGHLLSSVIKDIIPRYWTMKGFRVERRWGWDCHGLPIENIVEKQLNLKDGKKGIEALGIAQFNDACRKAIWVFDKEWEKVIRRIGRWVDMKNSYKTMDTNYMESVWWAFKTLYDKGYVYQGKKVILYCPRCSTPLSNFEIAMDNSYQEITETSTTYKFPVKAQDNTYLLAWSTTPWNKLATSALAVNPAMNYVKVRQGNEFYILAESRLTTLQGEFEITEHYVGLDLEKLEFTQLYDFYPDRQGRRAGIIVADDFVTAQEGTGIVTLAIYGEDDYRVMQKHHIQLVEHVDEEGRFKPDVTPWAGMDILSANSLIDEDLNKRNLIYDQSSYRHSVPVCYRCGTRLYYAPLPAWFIDIQKLKPKLKELNELVNWYPSHLKHGRFGKGLETAPDWNISRSRYWGTPMPVWVGQSGRQRIIGSIAELKEWAVNPESAEGLTDLHRESIDELKVWVDDQKTEEGIRLKEVFDCWVESGSMSFAAEHYPFENKAKFETRFPAQYIVEYIAQTRAWFYTLHVMSAAIFDKPAFQNALTTGTIMAEDGTKMSKSKKNYPDPLKVVDTYGADSLRLYFASSPVMKTAQNVNFSPEAINDIKKKVIMIMWNVFSFYKLYDDSAQDFTFPNEPAHVLDKWLIARLESLTQSVTESLDHYDVVTASRGIMDFVDDFSTWWLRLSRDRLRDRDHNQEVLRVFRSVLLRWTLLIAPFAPFLAEILYQNLVQAGDSIHLAVWPAFDTNQYHPELIEKMIVIRQAVEKAHAIRKEQGIKNRQPLAKITITSPIDKPQDNLLAVITQEVNVKEVDWQKGDNLEVNLDLNLTPELQAEGEARELVRQINDARKKMGTRMDEWVTVELPSWPAGFDDYLKTKVLARGLVKGETLKIIRD